MSTKNDVLQTLMQQEVAISGERLARRLGSSTRQKKTVMS